MKHHFSIYSYFLLGATFALTAFSAKIKIEQTEATQLRAEVECQLEPHEIIAHNSLQFSTNMPDVHVTKWFTLKEPQTYFDPQTKKTEKVYSEQVTFIVLLQTPQELPAHAALHVHYRTNITQQPEEKIFPLNQQTEQIAPEQTKSTFPQPPVKNHQKSTLAQKLTNLTTSVTTWIQDKELPLVIKFLLAFIIGLIMSLTPCIYPMIPITMGILQANKAHSLFRGFLLASAYTAGLSMTFAILGMIAAYGGQHFGSVMSNPWVIAPIILFFGYLAFSMLGFYEMYIPRFMQPRSGGKQKGSFVSAFTFGMINGTVASPCLSPGLALILGIVTSMANPVLGFLLLFVFGVGSSFPLLIIGTFSSSLHILPRAGMWMIEFKKVFGFLLLGMCIYYIRTFLPAAWIFYIALGLYMILVAAYYLHYGFKHRSWVGKLLGVIICVVAAFTLTQSYREINSTTQATTKKFPWLEGYDALRAQAITEKKLLLLDFTATWCSQCQALDKNFFCHPLILDELPHLVIPVKIDCTTLSNGDCANVKKKFAVIGFPTIILVNPEDEMVIQKWGSDLSDKEEFLEFIKSRKQ